MSIKIVWEASGRDDLHIHYRHLNKGVEGGRYG